MPMHNVGVKCEVAAGTGCFHLTLSVSPLQFNPVVDKLRGEGKEAKMIKGVVDKIMMNSSGGGEMNMNKVSWHHNNHCAQSS